MQLRRAGLCVFLVGLAGAALGVLSAAHRAGARSAANTSSYLFIWTGDGDRRASDLLIVLDADPRSKAYGRVVASASAGIVGGVPHHTEYEFPADGMLLANAWARSQTFLFDLRRPTAPDLVTSFHTAGPYAFPHSFARMPDGHLLGTFQGRGAAYAPPGGLVEIDERGTPLRSASAAGLGLADTLAWPYSLAIDAKHDRVVVTLTTMPIPKWLQAPAGSWRKSRADSVVTSQVEIWSLSSLQLLHVLTLPAPAQHGSTPGGYTVNDFAAEPRLLPDGTMYVNTFTCGLYRLTGIDGAAPRAELVHEFPAAAGMDCAVPAVVGHYWIQTVSALPGLIALDIRDPARPVEVSRLTLPSRFAMPHWLAADAKGSRVVLTGHDQGYVLVVDVDPQTGALAMDSTFRDERSGAVGVSLDGRRWPHGTIQRAFAHGALFGPR